MWVKGHARKTSTKNSIGRSDFGRKLRIGQCSAHTLTNSQFLSGSLSGGFRYQPRSEVLLHSHEKVPRGEPGCFDIALPKGAQDFVLMFKTFDQCLENARPIVRAAD